VGGLGRIESLKVCFVFRFAEANVLDWSVAHGGSTEGNQAFFIDFCPPPKHDLVCIHIYLSLPAIPQFLHVVTPARSFRLKS
jgi:hypothetical protein